MRKERNAGLYLRGKAVAGLARIPAPDVRRCPFPVPRRACLPYLMGKAPRPSALSRDASKIRRANSEALLPHRGEQRRSRTLAASLAPAGQGSVAQRMPLQAAGPCSWACRRLLPLPPHPNRNAARPPPRHESPPVFSTLYARSPLSRPSPPPAPQNSPHTEDARRRQQYTTRAGRKNSPRAWAHGLSKNAGIASPLTSEQPSPADGTGCRGRGNRDNRRSAL